ncbi:MAG: hypothetical protein NTZ05_02415 [Chloroflexi bacterium]|nr:hypothetical protein [Chloroflexota bacterium]
MGTMWLKACPKCGGDLMLEKSLWERTISCIQCGRTLRAEEEAHLGVPKEERWPRKAA